MSREKYFNFHCDVRLGVPNDSGPIWHELKTINPYDINEQEPI